LLLLITHDYDCGLVQLTLLDACLPLRLCKGLTLFSIHISCCHHGLIFNHHVHVNIYWCDPLCCAVTDVVCVFDQLNLIEMCHLYHAKRCMAFHIPRPSCCQHELNLKHQSRVKIHWHDPLCCSVLCSNWWCRKHMREYLPVVWMTEPNFVGYLKSANIYVVRFLFVILKHLNHIYMFWWLDEFVVETQSDIQPF